MAARCSSWNSSLGRGTQSVLGVWCSWSRCTAGMASLPANASASVDLPELDGPKMTIRLPSAVSGGISIMVAPPCSGQKSHPACGVADFEALLRSLFRLLVLAGIDLIDPELIAAIKAVERGERGLGVGPHQA